MDIKIIIALCLVLLYPVVTALCLRLARSARDEFAELTRKMLQDPTISEEHKTIISSMSDDVFDWRFMAFATIAFPLVAISGDYKRSISQEDREFMARDDASRLSTLHMRCVMAAAPFLTVVFLISATLSSVFLLLFSGASAVGSVWADTVKQVSPKATGPDNNHSPC